MHVTLVQDNALIHECVSSARSVELNESGLAPVLQRINVVLRTQNNLSDIACRPHVVFMDPVFSPIQIDKRSDLQTARIGYYEQVEHTIRSVIGTLKQEELIRAVEEARKVATHKVVLALPKRSKIPPVNGFVCSYRDKWKAYHVFQSQNMNDDDTVITQDHLQVVSQLHDQVNSVQIHKS